MSPTQPLKFIDLFCGIGGFRLAFERSGARCVFSSDWDRFSQQTYAANFGEPPHGNIYAVADADIPAHDILCAGFPCQPFSIAGVSKKLSLGRKHGFEDEKQGNRFFRLAEIINYHRPAAFVLENVKHLVRHESPGRGDIFVEPAHKTFPSSVRSGIFSAWPTPTRKSISTSCLPSKAGKVSSNRNTTTSCRNTSPASCLVRSTS